MDETQNDAPFVAFYDMHAVTFVPPDEMADVTIAGLQWFILIPPIKPHGVEVCPMTSFTCQKTKSNFGFKQVQNFMKLTNLSQIMSSVCHRFLKS